MAEIQKNILNIDSSDIINDSKLEQKKLSNEKLQSLSNNDFLRIPKENRLQYITNNKITTNDLIKKDLRIKNIEFNFTFENKFNRDLWIKTTAWQVLPSEVWSVEKKWITYIRNNLKWEFFAEDGTRLIINQNTKLKINELRDIKNLKKESESKISDYLKNNEKSGEYKDIIVEAADRGIKIEDAIKMFSSIIGSFPIVSADRKSILEDAFTNLDRIKWRNVKIPHLSEYEKKEIISRAPKKIKMLIKKYFPEDEYENALLVCNWESGFKYDSINYNSDRHSSVDKWLFQINDYWHADKYKWVDIYDPETNIRIASEIFKEANNSWSQWYAARNIGLA